MNDTVNTADIDDLLDSTLDDLEDLPSFEVFAAGAHKVLATLDFKTVNDKTVIELEVEMIETVELANPSDKQPAQGDKCSTIFMLDNEFGRGNLKLIATPLAEALGTSSVRDTVEETNSLECMIVSSIRTDKKDKDKKYLNIKEIAVV